VGLIPENELSLRAGVTLDPVTQGPIVDSNFMTDVEGIFACGNVLHVHDLVDYVSEEAQYCGRQVARFLTGSLVGDGGVPVKAGNLVRYVLPSRIEPSGRTLLSLRPIIPAEDTALIVRCGDSVLYRRKYQKVFPSSMLRIPLRDIPPDTTSLEVAFVGETFTKGTEQQREVDREL
jgi:hypothetical protein